MAIEVAGWLRQLGLEQYISAFRDNDVDGDVLPHLTAEDLLGMGVTSIGHRRKLLAAIAVIGAEASALAGTAASASAPGAAALTQQAEAERRQLTVVFCDIVDSTALSTQFDPEDLRELINAYHRAVAETVTRFDGFVAKYMGDGVLIYFGYPQAHEDDAERSVRAELAIIDAIAKLPSRVTLRVRIGIATGLAVVGDLIGAGAAQERGVVGETPIWRRGFKASRNRIRSSSLTGPAARSAGCSTSPISGRRPSPVSPNPSTPGGYWVTAARRTVSRLCAPVKSHSSGGRKKWRC